MPPYDFRLKEGWFKGLSVPVQNIAVQIPQSFGVFWSNRINAGFNAILDLIGFVQNMHRPTQSHLHTLDFVLTLIGKKLKYYVATYISSL